MNHLVTKFHQNNSYCIAKATMNKIKPIINYHRNKDCQFPKLIQERIFHQVNNLTSKSS